MLVHPVPVLYLATVGHHAGHFVAIFAIALIGLIGFQTIYEIGYLENDVFTVKRETAPTLRLSQSDMSFVQRHFVGIAALRIGTFLLCLYAIFALKPYASPSINVFIVVCCVTAIAFACHNRTRSRWNIVTYAVLAAGRYLSVPLLAWGFAAPATLFTAFLMMPLPRTLEHASKPKYELSLLRRITVPFSRFRPVYYLIATIGFVVVFGIHGVARAGAAVLAYFFVYRLAVQLVVRKGVLTPTIHPSYTEEPGEGET
jgi:hypothetical protein